MLDLRFVTSSLDRSVVEISSVRDVQFTLAADVLFAFDRASLTRRARTRLREVAARIRRADPPLVRIDGHTDAKGSPAYNLALSRRRAAAVRRALANLLGDDWPRSTVRGHGESRPVAPNTKPDGSDDPRGRARNRRVEIRFSR